MAAVRHRLHQTWTLGKFADGLKWAEELDQLCRKKGLAGATFWGPGFGKMNEMIIETVHPNMAAFEKDLDAFESDAEIMALFRKGTQILAEGQWPWDELEIEAPHLA